MHFVVDCPAYDHIREQYPGLFNLPTSASSTSRLRSIFDCEDQHSLVKCMWQMDLYRSYLLGLRYPQGARIPHQPNSYIPADVTLRCMADFGLPYSIWQGRLVSLLIVMMVVIGLGCVWVLGA